MNYQIFTWDRSYSSLRFKRPWIESFYLLGLLLAAILLFGLHLGSLPLTSEETLVVENARQIQERTMVFPLVPRLISLSSALFGINNAWTIRLPCALLTAISVPLLYSLSRELYVTRWPGLFASLMYLMSLPVVCSGRLANITGASLCFMVWTIACLLRSRRNLSWSLGVGLGLTLMILTDGISFLILATVIVVFLSWDTPRLLTSRYFLTGVFLGMLPSLLWYALFFQEIPNLVLLFRMPLGRSWHTFLDFLVLSVPWFVFWASGVKLAIESRSWGWAKLILVWLGVSLSFVLLFSLKVPELILLSVPTLSLAGGTILAGIKTLPSERSYPCFWSTLFSSLSVLVGVFSLGLFYKVIFNLLAVQQIVLFIFLALTITLSLTALQIERRDQQFIVTLFWGMYLVLLLFLSSLYWTRLG